MKTPGPLPQILAAACLLWSTSTPSQTEVTIRPRPTHKPSTTITPWAGKTETVQTVWPWTFVEKPFGKPRVSYWKILGPTDEIQNSQEKTDRIQALFAWIDQRDREEGLRPADRTGCPTGMVRVQGQKRSTTAVFLAQQRPGACTLLGEKNKIEKCRLYNRHFLKKAYAQIPRNIPVNTCMDQFEYPNIPYEFPVTMVTYHEAQQLCAREGKRMCTENEWTFACEGPDSHPYPYDDGFTRNNKSCTFDIRTLVTYDEKLFRTKTNPKLVEHFDELWAATPSGSNPQCRSALGLYDMVGNIDEFTRSDGGTPHESVMKGGWWGAIRGRCHPATTAHGPDFYIYEAGFRCCANPR